MAVFLSKARGAEWKDRSVPVFARRCLPDNPLLAKTCASGLEPSCKVGELNYRWIDFQDVTKTNKGKIFEFFANAIQKLPSMIVFVV